jgi:hypothetical protein
VTSDKAYSDCRHCLQDTGREYLLMFRILADVADEGVDFLGNVYRSAVNRSSTSFVTTDVGGDRDQYWLSAPQPSRFAVVNQYFDLSQQMASPWCR